MRVSPEEVAQTPVIVLRSYVQKLAELFKRESAVTSAAENGYT